MRRGFELSFPRDQVILIKYGMKAVFVEMSALLLVDGYIVPTTPHMREELSSRGLNYNAFCVPKRVAIIFGFRFFSLVISVLSGALLMEAVSLLFF